MRRLFFGDGIAIGEDAHDSNDVFGPVSAIYNRTSTFQPFIVVASLRVVSSRIAQYGKMSAPTDRRDIVIVGMNLAPHVTCSTPHSRW